MNATATERAADYHREHGSLTASIAVPLVMRTPAHAKAIMDGQYTPTSAMNLGTAVHQLLLRDDRVDVLQFPDFRTKPAQEARDASLAAGRVPITDRQWLEAREIAELVNGQILESNATPTPFTKGTAEHPIRWETDNGTTCRSLLDWLRDDRTYIDDLKTTSDASPAKFSRHVFNMGYDIRAAFYVRAVKAAYGAMPRFRWIAVETKPPYPVSIFELTDRAMASAQVKVDLAIQLWNECCSSGLWPAYGRDVNLVDIPGWMRDEADAWQDVDLDSVPF